jgi:hypothetical protein
VLKSFICPNGEQVEVAQCLEKCPWGNRCMTLPYLKAISKEREWKGIASTTQLLNGTMYEWLKLTRDYSVSPDSRTFMLAGTHHHQNMEQVAKELGLASEIALSVDRNIIDLVEVEDDQIILTDLKLWGSFKVAKALGITKVGKKPDPSGAIYLTTSKWGKAGDPKMVNIFMELPENIDNFEATYQLNRYRIMLQKLGVGINQMRLQVTVRDGGIAMATSRGVLKNSYLIPIKFLDNLEVESFFIMKADFLSIAMKDNKWVIPCNQQESWDGIKCARYCEVKQYCPKGALLNQLDSEEVI